MALAKLHDWGPAIVGPMTLPQILMYLPKGQKAALGEPKEVEVKSLAQAQRLARSRAAKRKAQ